MADSRLCANLLMGLMHGNEKWSSCDCKDWLKSW